MRWVPAVLLMIALAGASPAISAQTVPEVERAQRLLREGKAEEAWRLLAPLEKRHAGQPQFDLALAMAATDSGRPNLATFALERLIVTQPGNGTARLELARAFYALRDYERAQRELQLVLEGDPPPAVRALVAQYRDKMRDLPAVAAPTGWSGYAEAGVGHDTNATVATAQGSIFVPGLGAELLLERGFVRDRDNFSSLGLGLQYARALDGGLTALAGADLYARWHAELDIVDAHAVDLQVALRQRMDARDSVQYTLRHHHFELDHDGYRRMHSASAEWTRLYGERARVGLSAQAHRIRYPQESFPASSSDLVALGATGAYVLDATTRTLAFGGLFAGIDNAVAGRADGDRRILGASAGVQRRLAPGLEGLASASVLQSDYRQRNVDFGVTRGDTQLEAALALSWQLAEGWYLRPQLTRTRNRSNIVLNDFGRTEASLTLRRVWD
jgi:tetratricopeptide (TPR) repeat protein